VRMALRKYGDYQERPRINAGPQNGTAAQEGMTGIQRDGNGNVTGGFDRYGRGFGTKRGNEGFSPQAAADLEEYSGRDGTRSPAAGGQRAAGSVTPRLDAGPRTPGLDARDAGSPAKPVASPYAEGDDTVAAPAGSSLLKSRLALYQEMQGAGRNGLTQEMQDRAAALGVKPASWKRVAAGLPATGAATATAPSPAPTGSTGPLPAMPSVHPVQPPVSAKSPLVAQAEAVRDVSRTLEAEKASRPPETRLPLSGVDPVGTSAPTSMIPVGSDTRRPTPPAMVPRSEDSVSTSPSEPSKTPLRMSPTLQKVANSYPSSSFPQGMVKPQSAKPSWQPESPPQASVAGPPAPAAQEPAKSSGLIRDSNPVTFRPTAKAAYDSREKQVADQNSAAKREYLRQWNQAPNLIDSLGDDSGLNKAYKSIRTFARGYSY